MSGIGGGTLSVSIPPGPGSATLRVGKGGIDRTRLTIGVYERID